MLLLASACVLGGVATIEPVNKVIVPILLGLIVFSFYWAIFLPHASEGIIHMFSPNWGMYQVQLTMVVYILLWVGGGYLLRS